ncbi:MAG: penicillin acylase family protein [Desulfobacterales bacterium]
MMRSSIKWALFFLIIFIIAFGYRKISTLNDFHREGELVLSGLKEPVTVIRDEKGMAYIYAENIHDVIMAQGFITAQDRLFPMELTKLFATGRISELAGDDGKAIDVRMRTIGFHRNAKRHAKILNAETRQFLQKYVDGVNAYITTRADTHPLEFKLAGIKPGRWTIEDSISIMYYMGWDSSANLQDEVITQMLVEKLGMEKAKEIFPLNINPDDSVLQSDTGLQIVRDAAPFGFLSDKTIKTYMEDRFFQIGSNNWAVGSQFSASGKPIVANDPHLESSILPGPWYPCGLSTPQFRAIGVVIPGIPGMVVGRTDHYAIGVTNAYGDTQDLYVETLDPKGPDRYLEGGTPRRFEIIEETLRIKDKEAPGGYKKEQIRIRLTKRGPVISGVLPDLRSDKVITMRWSMFETMKPSLGFERLLTSKTAWEVREALRDVTVIMLNWVFADKDGNIGWQTTGKLPIRSQVEGLLPFVVKNSKDNWTDWIPFDEMPQSYNPNRGWVGTSNHKTVKRDYPYYYSSHFSASYRYRRLKELLGNGGKKTMDDHWWFQRDTKNLMASVIAPHMANILSRFEDTKEMAEILSGWDFRDDPDKVAPSVFQAIYREFALLVFEDELGKTLSETLLDNWYFWEERLADMVLKGSSPWFDNVETPAKRETLKDLFYQAALMTKEKLGSTLGENPKEWLWGKLHRMEFVSPIRRKGFGKRILGGGSHPAPGSGEALYRGYYRFNEPYSVAVPASLRMVADLGDDEKILAVLPGGVSGRLFDPHRKDQIKPYMNGDKVYWWFSDKAINAHGRHTLILRADKK